jgi:hypothetical protein
VLVVTAVELRHPITLLVLMETHDEPLRGHSSTSLRFDPVQRAWLTRFSAASCLFHSSSMADSVPLPIIGSGLEPFRHPLQRLRSIIFGQEPRSNQAITSI